MPLTLFGGLNSELSPTDLPPGLSPACSDVAFLPGAVFTRPPLQRLSTLGSTAQIVYTHTFPKNDGTIVKMDFDSLGGIWANGVKVGATEPGSRFYCANAFGRTFIAVSDGLRGTGVPLHFDGTNLDRVSQDGPGAGPTVANLGIAPTTLTSLARSQGTVTATTTAANNLRPGMRFQVSGVGTANIGGGVQSIVINNELTPGVATVTTNTGHGLLPGNTINLSGVTPVPIGGGITYVTVAGANVSFTMSSAHNLQVGSTVNIAGTRTPNVCDGQWVVATIVSPTEFGIVFGGTGAVGGSNFGTVSLVFPAFGVNDSYFVVQSVPSAQTFQIAMAYSEATWNTGTITFPWDGSFYVQSVVSSTVFEYSQAGPDASSMIAGTLTPQGQIAPGNRGVVCLFQTRSGFVTAPSPRISWEATGGQYAMVTDIPIGPQNVIARIIAFTGANGGRYFYIPVAPQQPGTSDLIGTATVIADNFTTTAMLDFSDEALEAGIAIDVPGNNLFQQEVLGPVLGFHAYEGRLLAWGERSRVQSFLNMGFEGGVSASAASFPLGWTVTGSGVLTAADYGLSWLPTGDAVISQSAFQDVDGLAILQPNTQYTFRGWVDGTVTATLSSANTGFTATAVVTASSVTAEAVFSAKTPAVIPSDFTLSFAGAPMDELEIIYTASAFERSARASYILNPEAFDGVTGVFGPADDPNPIRGMVSLNGVLSLLTSGPNGAHYRTEDSSSGEPASWTIRQHGAKCGLTSAWGIATFEDWFCWASDTGLRIFNGGEVDKMSQEVQTLWNSINPQASQFTVLANDPYLRRLYILAPTGTSVVPNVAWVMDYRELNTAAVLANSGTLRVALSGKVITTDITRKWCPWSITMNYCAMLTQTDGSAVMAFCGGKGTTLADAAHSAVYTLGENAQTGIDEDYGPFWQKCLYTTAFMPEVEGAQQLQLKPYRMLYTFLVANLSGVGSVFITPLLGGLNVSGRPTRAVPMLPTMVRDREFGLSEATERLALRFQCQPAGVQPQPSTAPAGFFLSSLVLSVLQHPHSEVSGWNKVTA